MSDIRNIAVGDYITFKAATRSHYRLATRKVVGIDNAGRPEVGYHGYRYFIVLPHEIVSVDRRAA